MSLILEALRKSEAERQRGRAPGLFVEQARTPARPRGMPGWAWGLVALLVLVLVLVAWGWREWERASATAAQATPASVETMLAPAPSNAASDNAGPAAMSAAPSPASAATPGPASLPPPPVASVPEVRPAPMVPSPSPSAREPGPGAAATPAPAPAVRSEAIGAPPPPAPGAEEPAFVPSLSSLAASQRAQLPPLKLSMHVFAEAPAQRFVILDGQRLGEGASPAAGLVVEEIRRDGLVLAVDGQRFLLPRP